MRWDQWFCKEEYLAQIGVPVNPDGSTSNISQCYEYVRDQIATQFKTYYLFYFWWAMISSLLTYLIAAYTMNGIMGSNGQTNDVWNSGVSLVIALILTYHLTVCLEARSFNLLVVFFIVFSLQFLPWTVILNDSVLPYAPYYGNQGDLFSQPLFLLVVFLNTCILLLPRFVWVLYTKVVQYPEFSKMKSS